MVLRRRESDVGTPCRGGEQDQDRQDADDEVPGLHGRIICPLVPLRRDPFAAI
jgi:hypothetical protein